MADFGNWSLRAKVGQMFMCGFNGHEGSDDIRKLIENYHIGGVVYFRRNLRDAEQVCRLSGHLQRMSVHPLLIAVDQEGGMVVRLEKGVTVMPGNMALGATGDIQGTYEAARISGQELRRIGINMNFAPCLDVNNNPLNPVIGVRSYGEDPQLVGRMGVAAVRGCQEAGLAAAVKHFPGHGDTDEDSHLALPRVAHDRARLDRVELAPFRQAIRFGADAVMTAHVIFPAYEAEDIPATLSRNILHGLLREQLQFNGVIVTDCLEMSAISGTIGVGQGAVRAVKAGADLLLISHRIDRQIEGIEAVIRAVECGEIPEERINESVRRLLLLKERREISGISGGCSELERHLGLESTWEVARRLSEKSVTLVKDEGGRLPLDTGLKTLVVWPQARVSTEVVEVIEQEVTLGAALKEYIDEVHEIIVGIEPTDEEIMRVAGAAGMFGQVVAATYNAGFSPGQIELVKKLTDMEGIALTVVALRNPFDLTAFPEVNTYLCSYENKPLAMRSLAKVLAGVIPAEGKLPVTVGDYACSSGAVG